MNKTEKRICRLVKTTQEDKVSEFLHDVNESGLLTFPTPLLGIFRFLFTPKTQLFTHFSNTGPVYHSQASHVFIRPPTMFQDFGFLWDFPQKSYKFPVKWAKI